MNDPWIFYYLFSYAQVSVDDKKKKRDATSFALREEVRNGTPKMEHRIYIYFPRPEHHMTHKIGQVEAMHVSYYSVFIIIIFKLSI